MFAFFRMITIAVATALGKGLDGLDWCWRQFCSILPGSGGGTPMPAKHLDLPDVDEAHEAKKEAADQQLAADYLLSSPERVVMAWARASKERRDTIPLTKLSEDQIDWLEVRLTEGEIKILAAEKSEYKVAAALNGLEDAILGVPSVPTRKTKSGLDLSDRIADFRMSGIERPPAFVH